MTFTVIYICPQHLFTSEGSLTRNYQWKTRCKRFVSLFSGWSWKSIHEPDSWSTCVQWIVSLYFIKNPCSPKQYDLLRTLAPRSLGNKTGGSDWWLIEIRQKAFDFLEARGSCSLVLRAHNKLSSVSDFLTVTVLYPLILYRLEVFPLKSRLGISNSVASFWSMLSNNEPNIYNSLRLQHPRRRTSAPKLGNRIS